MSRELLEFSELIDELFDIEEDDEAEDFWQSISNLSV